MKIKQIKNDIQTVYFEVLYSCDWLWQNWLDKRDESLPLYPKELPSGTEYVPDYVPKNEGLIDIYTLTPAWKLGYDRFRETGTYSICRKIGSATKIKSYYESAYFMPFARYILSLFNISYYVVAKAFNQFIKGKGIEGYNLTLPVQLFLEFYEETFTTFHLPTYYYALDVFTSFLISSPLVRGAEDFHFFREAKYTIVSKRADNNFTELSRVALSNLITDFPFYVKNERGYYSVEKTIKAINSAGLLFHYLFYRNYYMYDPNVLQKQGYIIFYNDIQEYDELYIYPIRCPLSRVLEVFKHECGFGSIEVTEKKDVVKIYLF